MAVLRPLARLVGRDLRLVMRQGSDAVAALMFFVLTIVLFPFGIGPEPNILMRIAPGLLLVGALLAALLSMDRLFQADYEDGGLEVLLLSPLPAEGVALGKVLAHWLGTGLPLTLIAPLLAGLLHMPIAAYPLLLGTLLLATPLLSLIGAVGAALTLGSRRSGVLLPLLVLPLYVPVLIFAAGALDAGLSGLPMAPHLLLLAGMLVAALVLAPFAAAAALRAAVE